MFLSVCVRVRSLPSGQGAASLVGGTEIKESGGDQEIRKREANQHGPEGASPSPRPVLCQGGTLRRY